MIKENLQKIFSELPEGVELVAATKGRSSDEILTAIDSGIKIIGENYVQEAEKKFEVIGNRIKWHFIGHLQKNKVKKAVQIFDIIETIDSYEIASSLDKVCYNENKVLPILVEVNSGKEKDKTGVFPEGVIDLIKKISCFNNIKMQGIMTMGPLLKEPEEYRVYFKLTKNLFNDIKSLGLRNVDMKYLSMGMSDSYKIAIQEGANIVRIGTKIFGKG